MWHIKRVVSPRGGCLPVYGRPQERHCRACSHYIDQPQQHGQASHILGEGSQLALLQHALLPHFDTAQPLTGPCAGVFVKVQDLLPYQSFLHHNRDAERLSVANAHCRRFRGRGKAS